MIPVIDSLLGIAKEGLALIPDPNKRAQMEADLEKARLDYEARSEEAQADIDKIEAQSQRLFVAGWRPFIGWTCGVALAWQFVLQPFIVSLVSLAGYHINLPTLDFGTMSTILLGMLGLGTMRTVEKVQGVASGHG